METGELLPHLFRTEYRKIVSVLCRRFGLDQIETAEDIASDTFLTASQAWGVKGLPENPTAWLYSVAKNKAKNHLQRAVLFESSIAPELKRSFSEFHDQEIDLSPQNISDSQLQMMFAVCHPSISSEAQIGLSLRILCGFGIEEIADAFLTTKETINKRLFRAKARLREERISIGLPSSAEIDDRLATVLATIYLLFNEGYYSLSQDETLRKDLCLEAMRLCHMLVENRSTNKPQVNALLSLMCFHASRFEARLDGNGELIPYDEQDASLWNADLISKGGYFLSCAARGDRISKYHFEAESAYWNTQQADTREKWENILQLYDRLLRMEYSPTAALNRMFALSKVVGKREAIGEAEKLKLTDNHLYFALLGELYTGTDIEKAKESFQEAIALAKTPTGKQAIQNRLDKL
jgi:RNA polymerase sigma factor (sigma-70 family)